MTYLFISDLHLSPDHPRLVRGFLDLLKHYQDKNTQLYILGDWFNAWVGDDDPSEWLKELVEHLKAFSQAGNQIVFIAGNRDFALGQDFLDQFNGVKMNDVSYLLMEDDVYIGIEHGDLLCTDDTSYQRFRKIIRHPLVLKTLLATPLKFRQMLAHGFRKKSKQSKQVKSYDIMDVNEDAVARSISALNILIHGHTHRPAIHHFYNKKRVVLGDWRESEAKILEIDPNNPNKLELKTWSY